MSCLSSSPLLYDWIPWECSLFMTRLFTITWIIICAQNSCCILLKISSLRTISRALHFLFRPHWLRVLPMYVAPLENKSSQVWSCQLVRSCLHGIQKLLELYYPEAYVAADEIICIHGHRCCRVGAPGWVRIIAPDDCCHSLPRSLECDERFAAGNVHFLPVDLTSRSPTST